jgi:hypothetical protein
MWNGIFVMGQKSKDFGGESVSLWQANGAKRAVGAQCMHPSRAGTRLRSTHSHARPLGNLQPCPATAARTTPVGSIGGGGSEMVNRTPRAPALGDCMHGMPTDGME